MAWEVEHIGDCTLYRADCRDILPMLPSVEAVVTDPVYGIGFRYLSGREPTSTPQAWWAWFRPLWADSFALLVPGGFWAVWCSGRYHRYLWTWFGEETHVYIAAKNFVQLRPTPINYAYDPVAIGYKAGGRALCPETPPRNLDFAVGNTAGVVGDRTRLEKGHPAPRPLDQVLHLVTNFTCRAGQILDPFMGSGTTGVACVRTGRRFIGVEIEPAYFTIACKRIEEAYAQPDLFVPRGLAPQQLSLEMA
jgi:site-specific DNA-methyltransferase (adenine-specific)